VRGRFEPRTTPFDSLQVKRKATKDASAFVAFVSQLSQQALSHLLSQQINNADHLAARGDPCHDLHTEGRSSRISRLNIDSAGLLWYTLDRSQPPHCGVGAISGKGGRHEERYQNSECTNGGSGTPDVVANSSSGRAADAVKLRWNRREL
jgi:hypothetical protein